MRVIAVSYSLTGLSLLVPVPTRSEGYTKSTANEVAGSAPRIGLSSRFVGVILLCWKSTIPDNYARLPRALILSYGYIVYYDHVNGVS